MAERRRVYVLDTCAIITIRSVGLTGPALAKLFAKLDPLVISGEVVYPPEVLKELEGGLDPERHPEDLPYQFAERNGKKAAERAAGFKLLTEVLSKVPKVVDPKRSVGKDADPYVLACGMNIQGEGDHAVIVTEDRREVSGKLSVTTACGILRLDVMPTRTFLAWHRLWRPAGR